MRGIPHDVDCGTPGTVKVRLRSVPHVSTGRLARRLAVLHDAFHTPAGLHAFDGPRDALIRNGLILVAIRDALAARGAPVVLGCRICDCANPST
jgi:hypothetical protein